MKGIKPVTEHQAKSERSQNGYFAQIFHLFSEPGFEINQQQSPAIRTAPNDTEAGRSALSERFKPA